VLLVLKLVLVPGLVAAATLAIRRWGPRIGGWLTGMPIVAGPALFFLAMEQGDQFAAEAAGATLVALIAVAAFGLTYGWLALRTSWPASLLVGWGVFGALTPVLHAMAWRPVAGLGAVLTSLVVAQRLLPPARGRPTRVSPPAWDLPLRMAGALAVVLTVTQLAERLGPGLSGALAPFPIALAVILAFAHAQQGAPMAVRLLRGFLPAMWAFAVFCFALAVTTVPLGRYAAFALAIGAQLAVQGVTFWWLTRR
jgi:hypothetical protein